MCCEHDQPRPMSREEVEMRARWQRERELLIAQRFYADHYAQDYVRQRVIALLREQGLVAEETARLMVISQPTPVAQPAEVAKELVLA